MVNTEARPKGMTNRHTDFLIDLRDSAETNMMAAGGYLQEQFGLDKHEAKEYLLYWMGHGPFEKSE